MYDQHEGSRQPWKNKTCYLVNYHTTPIETQYRMFTSSRHNRAHKKERKQEIPAQEEPQPEEEDTQMANGEVREGLGKGDIK